MIVWTIRIIAIILALIAILSGSNSKEVKLLRKENLALYERIEALESEPHKIMIELIDERGEEKKND